MRDFKQLIVVLVALAVAHSSKVPKKTLRDVPDYYCPPTNDDPTVYPNLEDCHSYYLCNFGNLVPEECPNGLEFSIDLGRCEYPDVANCQLSPSTVPPTTLFPPTETAAPPDTPKPPNYSCPPTNEETILYPSPYSCSDFYICNWGELVLEHCQEGLEYSQELRACEEPEVAQCDLSNLSTYTAPPVTKPTPTESTQVPPDFPCPPTDEITVLYPSPYSCSDYYICDWGKLVLEHCPAGLEYSIEHKSCDFPELAQCDPSGLSTYTAPPLTEPVSTTTVSTPKPPDYYCPPTNDVTYLYPSPYSCDDFYICNWGSLVIQHCQEGLQYSIELKSCVYPEQANCDLSSLSTYTPPPVTPGTDTPAPGTTGTPAPDTTSIPGVYCPPDTSGTLVRNPVDCSSFYECNYGLPQLEECSAGLVFNEEIQQCDYPANVPECSSSA